MSNSEFHSGPEGADASMHPSSISDVSYERRVPRERRKKSSAQTLLSGMILAHIDNHPEDPFDYTKARNTLGVTKQWMWKIRQDLKADGKPLPESAWEHAKHQKKEAKEAVDDASTQPIASRGVLFENSSPKPRGVRTTARVKLLNILQTHLEDDADKPFDYVRVRKILGISNSKFSELKKSTYEAGFPLPTSMIEHNQWLRRQAGIPKRTSSAILRATRDERRSRIEAARLEWEQLNSVREARVRDLYKLGWTYPEIARDIGTEDLSSINHMLERLEKRREITRRKKRPGKKDSSTSSS